MLGEQTKEKDEKISSRKIQDLSIEETSKVSDFVSYISLVIKERLFHWVFYIVIVKLLGKDSRVVVIRNDKSIIGGFFITDFPFARYKTYNWFKKDVQRKIDEIVRDDYKYFGCFVVKREFRNKGIGTFVFESYLKKNHKKIWFTSSPKAVSFYLRNGANLFYKSKYNIYVFK